MESLKLVIDEAAQMKESEAIIPLQVPGMALLILIGYECQLLATVKSVVSKNVTGNKIMMLAKKEAWFRFNVLWVSSLSNLFLLMFSNESNCKSQSTDFRKEKISQSYLMYVLVAICLLDSFLVLKGTKYEITSSQ
ncbi:unnamed protein product [Lactuca virosa]|uniref:DNA2/NAM7 helicase helicase domain-containing protein n=1 Tax=Lactuca virosa TaxID=75947 RepID=A0AAU9NE02_9ASTR|nr:unnamed protein product [Lactuca virosa]